jgi:aminomethyltransferase
MQKTALNDRHRGLGAKMTDFHGWEMPLFYTSILEEHKAVRQGLGIFDISHMGQVLVTGPDAMRTLNQLMTSDFSQVAEGRACYTLMLNEAGGIVDDLIVYRIGPQDYLDIVNCGNRTTDVEWLQARKLGNTTVTDISQGRCIVAVQGPLACRVLEQLLDARVTSLVRFGIAPIRTMGPDACIARTGYTGGDGFELFVPEAHAKRVWDLVLSSAKALGASPCGLGARDTLRLEAGLRLYGTDMDDQTTPWEVGLDWTVAMAKADFMGRQAIERKRAQPASRKFVGFELSQGPVPRTGMELSAPGAGSKRAGVVTSGTFSPILNKAIGMGYVEPAFGAPGTALELAVRSQRYAATVVKLPFWKGQAQQPVLAQTVRTTLEKLPE